jgi:bifunctional DNA-binding transcriptional regulator/antitoxin component of YhaV-PrlF toxin-antitoxin module
MKFRTTIRQSDGSATGIVIPDEVMAALGAGKKPPVRLSVNGHEYRSTVATIDGRSMVGFSAAHREASGLGGGDEVEVDIEVDREPRIVEVPSDLQAALDAEPLARATFEKLSNSLKGYHVSQVLDAKTAETRQRRIEKSVALLREGKPR